jgi:hypothetical protein
LEIKGIRIINTLINEPAGARRKQAVHQSTYYFMKVLLIIILSLAFLLSCKNGQQVKNPMVDKPDSIFSSLSEKNIQSFDFKNLKPGDLWNWKNNPDLKKVDTGFYKVYLADIEVFSKWNNYQDLFWLGTTQCKMKNKLILAQWIHNGDESNMYLIGFDENGLNCKTLKVAALFKSSNDFIFTKSNIIDGKIIRVTVRYFVDIDNKEISYKDSITENIDLGNFKVGKSDSIRIKK